MHRIDQTTVYYILAICWFAWAYKDTQTLIYMFTAGFMVHIFFSRPDLFGPLGQSKPATTAPVNTPKHIPTGRSRSVDRYGRSQSKSGRSPIVQLPTPARTSTPIMLTTGPISRDWELNRKPSKLVFARATTSAPASTRAPSPALTSNKRAHRVPAVSAGHSPFAKPTQSFRSNDAPVPLPPRSDSITSSDTSSGTITTTTPTVKSFFAAAKQRAADAAVAEQVRKVEVPAPTRPLSQLMMMKVLGKEPLMVDMNKRLMSPVTPITPFESPLESPCRPLSIDYDSDSSRASSSSVDTRRSMTSMTSPSTHHRKTSSLARFNSRYTTVTTFVPRSAQTLVQVKEIIEEMREHWLTLPGSVSHEVGMDAESDAIVIVETYASKDDHGNFERSPERHHMLAQLQPLVDEDRITILRMPGTSAVNRLAEAC